MNFEDIEDYMAQKIRAEDPEYWKKADSHREKNWEYFNSLLPNEKVEYINKLRSINEEEN